MVAGRVWAIRREVLESLDAHFRDRVVMGSTELQAQSKKAASPKVTGNGVAVVPISGMIAPKLTFMAWLMGADAGLDDIMSGIKAAVADPDVSSVVLDIDSPGGLVDGVPEAAAQIRQLRNASGKPMIAVANPLTASAAYWLASQAHEMVVSPSGEVGSVGVYQLHRDVSGAMEQMGVKHTLIHAGAKKVEGNPYEPLDPEAAAWAQQAVDDYYGMFVADVAAGRSHDALDATPDPEEVTNGTAFGAGRVYTAKRAVKAGLADRVATLPETISRLSSGRAKIRRSADDDGAPINADDTGLHSVLDEDEVSDEDRHRLVTVLAELGTNPE